MHSILSTDELISFFIALWAVFAVGVILWAVYDWDLKEDKVNEKSLSKGKNENK